MRYAGVCRDDSHEVISPLLQGCLLFFEVAMPVVDRSDAANSTALMVEHFLDDMWRDADSSHAAGRGPAQVVKAPISYLGEIIEAPLSIGKPSDRDFAIRREHEGPVNFGERLKDCSCGR